MKCARCGVNPVTDKGWQVVCGPCKQVDLELDPPDRSRDRVDAWAGATDA